MQKFKSSFRDDPEKLWARIEKLKARLGWHKTSGMARKWWNSYESQVVEEPRTVLRVLQEIEKRKITIIELFSAALFSGRESMEGNIEFFDFTVERCGKIKPREEDFREAGSVYLS